MKEIISLFFKQTFLIARKDFKYLVFSPLFGFWTGISCILLSFIFPRQLFMFASSYLLPFGGGGAGGRNLHFEVFAGHISFINLILLFAVPILGMKILAEEKRNHSFDLLMTSPISSLQIVLGKYLALLSSLSIFLILSLFYPFTTLFFADVSLGPLFSSYVGLFLITGFYSATCLFASSLSGSLFLSAFIGVILNISLLVIFQGAGGVNSPFWSAVLDYMSLSGQLYHFIKGTFSLSSIVFFLSAIGFFLFLVFKSVEFNRWK